MIARLLVGLLVVAGAAAGTLAYRVREGPAIESTNRKLVLRREAVPAGPAVLVFTSSLCLACRRTPGLVAEALDVDEAELRAGEAHLAFAAIDVAEEPELTAALDVTRTPTIVGLDRQDRVAFAREGNPEPDVLARELESLAEGQR